ncbi:MAG: hypothetical protein U1F57_07190 [bacterium]
MKKHPLHLLSFLFFVLSLIACAGAGAPGGGASPVGGGESGIGTGNAGAPPISIPGPEALNMDAVTVSAPDSAGNVTVTGMTGAGTPGQEARLRDIGSVTSRRWPNKIEKLFIPNAVAAAGGSCNIKVLPDGAFKCIISGAAVGDFIAMKQCDFRGNCSAELAKQVLAVDNTSGPATIVTPPTVKGMTVDSKGNIFTNSSNKSWKWTDLFISNAYGADEGHDSEPTPHVSTTVLTPTPSVVGTAPINLEGRLNPLQGFTAATCADLPADYSPAPAASPAGKTCTLKKTGSDGNAEVLATLTNCNPEAGGIYYFEQSAQQKLAVWSENKLWVINTNQKGPSAVEEKRVYWSNISGVQAINDGVGSDNLFVVLEQKTGANYPLLAINHDCIGFGYVRELAPARKVTGFTSFGSSFMMSVDFGRESCLVFGSSGEITIGALNKDPVTCQAAPFTDVGILKAEICGLQYVALSPDTKELIQGFHATNLGYGGCNTPSYIISKRSIQDSGKPVSLAVGRDRHSRGDKVVVLVTPTGENEHAKLFPFQVNDRDNRVTLQSMMPVDLGVMKPTLLRYSSNGTSEDGQFVTNVVDTTASSNRSSYVYQRSSDFKTFNLPTVNSDALKAIDKNAIERSPNPPRIR